MGNVEAVSMVLSAVALYAAIGLAFALVFVSFALRRIDPGTRGSGLLFRLAILPGVIALWPLMLVRWIVGGAPHGGGQGEH